jgi:hypothetical protein
MTEGALFVAGGIALAGALVAQVVDYVQTVKGLDKGAKEVGPIASKVVAKWGVGALPVYTFLRAVATLGGAAVFGTIDSGYFVSYSVGMLAGSVITVVRNAKQKI